MKTTYYEKIGRRYVAVSEWDPDLVDALPKGNHLIMVYPGGTSRRYNIDPAYAPMIAAGRIAEEAIRLRMAKEQELRPVSKITVQQRRAFDRFLETMPEDDPHRNMMTHGSIHDCIEAGVKAMSEEAEKLLRHPSVRAAYEQFLLTCELCKEHKDGS